MDDVEVVLDVATHEETNYGINNVSQENNEERLATSGLEEPNVVAETQFHVEEEGGSSTSIGDGVDDGKKKKKKKKQPKTRPPLQLEWKDVTFKVKVRASPPPEAKGIQKVAHLFKKDTRTILFPMSGFVSPGSVLAIMGPSGAGKTSLLNILAQRVKQTDGLITVNGKNIGKTFRALSAFVQQDDVLLGNLTVRECLKYAAWLRIDSSVSWKDKQLRIQNVAEELGLIKCLDTYVGVPGVTKGISGGERKRLSIAIELLTEPSILFLDEPTTGLDSRTAQNVMETIGKIAKNGRAVVLTIHQPRSNIFKMFDKLLLLSRGRVAYFGPAQAATTYFAQIPPIDPRHPEMFKCPSDFNPSDFLIDLITETTSLTDTGKEQKMLDNKRINYILDYTGRIVYEPPSLDADLVTNLKFSPYRTNWFVQLFVILIRSFVSIMRDRVLTMARGVQSVVMALVIGFIFFRLGNSQKNVQDRMGVIFFILAQTIMSSLFGSMTVFLTAERPVFMRERGSKTYRVSSYYLGKAIAEIPNSLAFPIVMGTIAYWMVGLNPSAARFFTFILIVIMVALSGQALGNLVAAIVPSMAAAMALGPVLITLLMLFGGFYIKVSNIPPWFIWIYWISMFHFGYEAFMLNEFKGLKFVCPPTPQACPFPTGDDLIVSVGMDQRLSNVWINIGFMGCVIVVCRILAYIILRFLRKPRAA